MAYEKLNLRPYDPWKAEHVEHIESGIEAAEKSVEDLCEKFVDTKVDVSYEFVSQTCNINSPTYRFHRDDGGFSGYCACIGKPSEIGSIMFPVRAREGQPFSDGQIAIYEMPDLDEIEIGTSGPTTSPLSWNKLGSTKFILEEAVESHTEDTIVRADFDTTIVNTSGKYLMAHIYMPVPVTLGLIEVKIDDIPYNPWYWYSSGGASGVTRWPSTYTNNTTIYCLPVACYAKNVSDPYTVIGTGVKDKFFNLVNECINNSESFSTLFAERFNPKYSIGSANLTLADPATTTDKMSTFTGVAFYAGEIPSTYKSDGISLSIYSHGYNGSTTPVTKVWAYAYTVDTVPTYSAKPGWGSLNPVLVASGSADCNIPVDETGVVTVWWDEPFVNTGNKKIMIAYNTNSYSTRRFLTKGSGATAGEIDGKTYSGSFFSYYQTSQKFSSGWSSGWEDKWANAWCFVTKEKVYDFGDKFYSILDDALASSQVQTAPTSEVRLAKQYDLVVGDTFQLFYEGVVKSFAPLNDGIRVKCEVGAGYPRYYEFTPSASHSGKTYTLTLTTRRLDGTVISEGKTKLVVHPKPSNENTPSNVNMLLFGDSLTGGGLWCSEGLRRIYGTNTEKKPLSNGVTNTVTTYGANTNSNNPYYNNSFPVRHEGYSGWTWGSFLSKGAGTSTTSQLVVVLDADHNYDLPTLQKSKWVDNNGVNWELEDLPSNNSIKFNRGEGNNAAANSITIPTTMTCSEYSLTINNIASANWGSSNPFYNAVTGEISVKSHAAAHGIDETDIAACLLTWNGATTNADFNNTTAIENHMNNAATIFRQIHADFPNCKVLALGIQISDLNGGCAKVYGANSAYSDTWGTAFYAFDYNKALEELCTSSEFKDYVYYVDTKGQFDTRNNMPARYKAANTRNDGIKELIGVNGLHPYQHVPHEQYDNQCYGYWQIGDAFYRALAKVIPIVKSIKES